MSIDPDAPSVAGGRVVRTSVSAKVCTGCGLEQPIEQFPKSSRVRTGRLPRCQACTRAYFNSPAQRETRRRYNQSETRKASTARYEQGKRQQYVSSGRRWASVLAYKYGLTFECWHQLLIGQSGRCAACCVALRGDGHFANSAMIDHDHATGAVRGLLCLHCNTALGLLKESVNTLKQILSYLGAP